MTIQPQWAAGQSGSFSPPPATKSGISGPGRPRGRIAADLIQVLHITPMIIIAWGSFMMLLFADATFPPVYRDALLEHNLAYVPEYDYIVFNMAFARYTMRYVYVMILGMVAVVCSGVSFFSPGRSQGNLFAAIPLFYSWFTMLVTAVEWSLFRLLVE